MAPSAPRSPSPPSPISATECLLSPSLLFFPLRAFLPTSPALLLPLLFTVFFPLLYALPLLIASNHRQPLRLLCSLSPPQPWPSLLTLAATDVFPPFINLLADDRAPFPCYSASSFQPSNAIAALHPSALVTKSNAVVAPLFLLHLVTVPAISFFLSTSDYYLDHRRRLPSLFLSSAPPSASRHHLPLLPLLQTPESSHRPLPSSPFSPPSTIELLTLFPLRHRDPDAITLLSGFHRRRPPVTFLVLSSPSRCRLTVAAPCH